MAFKLTKKGIEKDIKSEDLDLPRRSDPPQEVKKPIPVEDAVKNWNNKPEVKSAGVMAVSKKTYYGIWTFAIIVVLLLATNIVWSNINVSTGKMQGNVSVINNVDTPDVPVTVNDQDTNNYQNNFTIQNNNTIIVTVDVGDQLAQQIADEFEKIINNNTNSS
jgi:hypothetical protein